MKSDVHPDNYRLVVFKDTSCDYSFLTRSTVETKEVIKWMMGKNIHYVKLKFQINRIHFSRASKI